MSEDFVKVPYYIERDGSKTHFLPNVRQAKGYRIGEKGSEQLVADYWEALELVRAMATPRFRRKNSEGNVGIVACKPEQVEEVSRAAIEVQLAQLAGELQ
jgi:hypothetical protein